MEEFMSYLNEVETRLMDEVRRQGFLKNLVVKIDEHEPEKSETRDNLFSVFLEQCDMIRLWGDLYIELASNGKEKSDFGIEVYHDMSKQFPNVSWGREDIEVFKQLKANYPEELKQFLSRYIMGIEQDFVEIEKDVDEEFLPVFINLFILKNSSYFNAVFDSKADRYLRKFHF
jgi:hypothetical protein